MEILHVLDIERIEENNIAINTYSNIASIFRCKMHSPRLIFIAVIPHFALFKAQKLFASRIRDAACSCLSRHGTWLSVPLSFSTDESNQCWTQLSIEVSTAGRPVRYCRSIFRGTKNIKRALYNGRKKNRYL